MSRRSVEEWRRAVYRSHRINDATRVYLLYLADHMRSDRKVSIPQASIEKALAKPKRRIDSRRAAAIAAGFLGHVSAGYRGSAPRSIKAPSHSKKGCHLLAPFLYRPTAPIQVWSHAQRSQKGCR